MASSASAGSCFFSSSADRPMALSAPAAVLLGSLAVFRAWFILTRAVSTVSRPAPVRRATSSRLEMFSMVAPVASATSFKASTESVTLFTKPTRPPARAPSPPAPARVPITALSLAPWACRPARLRLAESTAARVLSWAVRTILVSVATGARLLSDAQDFGFHHLHVFEHGAAFLGWNAMEVQGLGEGAREDLVSGAVGKDPHGIPAAGPHFAGRLGGVVCGGEAEERRHLEVLGGWAAAREGRGGLHQFFLRLSKRAAA